MNNYPYENISDDEFENLVIRICKEVLGIGCKTFSVGKDGAKDSWFTGKADSYPSKSAPWEGRFNIQAKHTKILNASCSDNDFSVNRTSVIDKEITRLKEVQIDTPFENYIIFTNRKLSGGIHPVIINKLGTGLGVGNVEIIGREDIDAYLNDYPQIADQFGLYKFIAPLRFYEKDIKDVIVYFNDNRDSISAYTKNIVTSLSTITKEEKNRLNNLSEQYFNYIKKHSLQYFDEIDNFLRDPINIRYMNMYSNTVSDLQEAILIERNRFSHFEQIIRHLVEYIVGKNSEVLTDLRSIVRVFVHFMYFNCDIGITE